MLKIKQLIGIAGALLLLLGVFLPAIKVPFLGITSYIENQEVESYIIITFAVLTMVFIAIKKQKGLWFTGLGSFGVLVYSYNQFQNILAGKNAQLENDFGAFYKELSGMFSDVIQLQWGVTVLLGGSVLIILSALIKKPS